MRPVSLISIFFFIIINFTLHSTGYTADFPKNWPWRGIVITSASSVDVSDIKYLAGIHVNAIELHLDVRQAAQRMKLSPAAALQRDLAWADQALDACKKYGITGILSFFQIPIDPTLGFYQESPEFWDNPDRRKEAINIAAQLADRFKNRGLELGGYSILSEPAVRRNKTPELPAAWPELMRSIVKTIRQRDPKRYITVSLSIGGMPNMYAGLRPLDDPYIIYEAHMYVPHPYTHQGIYGHPLGGAYPGSINFRHWDRKALEEFMSPLIEFQKKYDVPIFVGEFSAVRWAPGAEHYLKDLIDIFDSHGWSWVYFQYKSWHGWDPDFDSLYSTNDDARKHYRGRDTARWKLLRDAYAKNKTGGPAIP